MDLLAILNIEDVPPYGHQSSPSLQSDPSPRTPSRCGTRGKIDSKDVQEEPIRETWISRFTGSSGQDHLGSGGLLYEIQTRSKSFCFDSKEQKSLDSPGRVDERSSKLAASNLTQRSSTQLVNEPSLSYAHYANDMYGSCLSPTSLCASNSSDAPSSHVSPKTPTSLSTPFSPGSYHRISRHTRSLSKSSAISEVQERLPGVSEILQQSFCRDVGDKNSKAGDGRRPGCTHSSITKIEPARPKDIMDTDATMSDDGDDSDFHVSSSQASQKCTYTKNCQLESPDRRVISHFFGRNKKETRAIPDSCWVNYCRQHYQRCRYRMSPQNFAATQMRLVRATVSNLERWGAVQEWDIAIRKRALDQIAHENELASMGVTIGGARSTCRERVLLPHLGKHKSFADVYALIAAVEKYSADEQCEALEFEVVPQYFPGFMAKSASTSTSAGPMAPASAPALSRKHHSRHSSCASKPSISQPRET